MKSIKMFKRRQSEFAYILLQHKYKRTHDISECYVQFHSEIFSAKPKEFIGCQTDHRWWDLGSPDGFMGRIWWPGDHILAALVTAKLASWWHSVFNTKILNLSEHCMGSHKNLKSLQIISHIPCLWHSTNCHCTLMAFILHISCFECLYIDCI